MRPTADGKKLLWWREVLVLMDRSLLPEGSVTTSVSRVGAYQMVMEEVRMGSMMEVI